MMPTPHPRLFTLSGIDCAGKSTQIERLVEHLTAEGHRCVVLWYRPGYSERLDKLRAFVRKLRPGLLPKAPSRDKARREPSEKEAGRRAQLFRRPLIRRIWVAVALMDTFIQYAVVVRKHLEAGETVICDRQLFDASLDLNLRFSEISTNFWTRGLFPLLAPRPNAALLLMIPWEAMEARMAIKDEPFPDAPLLRRQRFNAYRALSEGADAGMLGSFEVIDASQSIEKVHASIVAVLQKKESL